MPAFALMLIHLRKRTRTVPALLAIAITTLVGVYVVGGGFSQITGRVAAAPPTAGLQSAATTVQYVLDSHQSKFMAHASAGGLLWFKGHDHHLAAREFAGEVAITEGTVTPASLRIIVKADSLEETGAVFTEPQKQIINRELREIVLHPDKYPEIVFQSTSVNTKPAGGGRYDVRIAGELTLHGITRSTMIPASVSLSGNDLRAVGEFSIDRDDFKVKATSAFHGLVRVRDKVKFEFDIVGHRK